MISTIGMAGLVPAIHVLGCHELEKCVDARAFASRSGFGRAGGTSPGHDGGGRASEPA
ncbi:hypothetical protein ACVWZ6_003710 [Bradyrhizobium sp. GM6.1]|jgi:hypothetical protein